MGSSEQSPTEPVDGRGPGEIKGPSQPLHREGATMATTKRRADPAARESMHAPGRPPSWSAEHRRRFWVGIAQGQSSVDAAPAAGVCRFRPEPAWTRGTP